MPAGLLLGALLILSGCGTLGKPPVTEEFPVSGEFPPEWYPMDEGLDFFFFRGFREDGGALAVYALRADMSSGIWEPVFTRPAESSAGFSMEGMKTSRFLSLEGCRAAVNGGPFEPYRWFCSGRGQRPVGVYVWKGEPVEPPVDRFGAFAADDSGKLSIRSQEDFPFQADYVLGGFNMLLDRGEAVPPEGGPVDARTAVGLSRDGNYLFLVVVDGRRPEYSTGLTLAETSGILKELGAWNGLNLDGGGSSVMVIDRAAADGKDTEPVPVVVNRPVNRRGFPERIAATHLGIRKKGE